MPARHSRLDALLLAESLRLRGVIPDDQGDARWAEAALAGAPEARLLAWSAAQPGTSRLIAEQRAARAMLMRNAVLAAAVIALLSGASLGLLLSGVQPINASALLAALLGWPIAMLLLWLLLRLLPASGSANGGWLHALSAKVLRRLSPGTAAPLALLARGDFGVWARSTLLHLAWASAFAGTIAACAFRFLFQQYDFVWQTTLLTPDALAAVLRALAAGPALLGWPQPGSDLAPEDARRIWGLFVIGCLVSYGLLPRLLAAALCWGMARARLQRTLLDLSHPYWVEILLRISRAAQVTTAHGAPAPTAIPAFDGRPRNNEPDRRPVGQHVAVLRLEPAEQPSLRASSDLWHAVDLGGISGRADQKRIEADLRAMSARPAAVLVVCALTRTPDRGAVAALQAVSLAASAPLHVLLSDRDVCRQRGDDVDQRITDWQRHAADAGAVLVSIGELASLLARPLPDAMR